MSTVTAQQIEDARSGDEVALAAIIAQLMPAVRQYAARAVCPGLEFDDAVQEGIIGLFGAIETFSAGKAASFKTYAGVCIQNAVTSALRKAVRKKHAPLNNSVPLSEQQSIPGPEQIAEAGEAYSHTLRTLHSRLSAKERQVLDLFLQQQSYAAIAARLNMTEKSVDNALQRIRSKLK